MPNSRLFLNQYALFVLSYAANVRSARAEQKLAPLVLESDWSRFSHGVAHIDTTLRHSQNLFLKRGASLLTRADPLWMQIIETSTSKNQMRDNSQLELDDSRFSLQNLYWVLGVGVMLGAVTFCSEFFFETSQCSSSLAYLWFLALQAAGHLCMCQSIVHFGHQILDLHFGPQFLCRGVIYFLFGLGLAASAQKSTTDKAPVFWPQGCRERCLLVLQGVCNSLGQLMVMTSLVYATAPVVSVVLCSSAILMALGSFLVFGETLKWPQWVSMILGISVVTLLIYATATNGVIDRMFQDSLNLPLGVGIAVIGASLVAAGMIIIRSLKGEVHYFAFLVGFGSWALFFSIALAFFFFNDFAQVLGNLSVPVTAVLAWQGISAFLAQLLMNKIAQLAKLGPIQTFINAAGLVFLCIVDLFMGYKYQILAWVCFLLTLVWLPLSYIVELYCRDVEASSQDSTKS
eukprot:gnl/MRDRNA2_/MRDRNA2_124585_c0_seq1.p1 gnl/MRDRNA2_/MRDRNA2_124585_c0~~gnl/MRDRNA2_/MRDRNA2_124585_c0_seq1.p1  ORF type:complete len:459 (+),score=41.56 gnl/MRDRNA2_/MRDRNA2_124585_c0_seq1:117-1493(+)